MTNAALLGSFGDVGGGPLVFRNKLINGGFDIWQRAISQTSSGYGSDDRWDNGSTGTTKTASQQLFTPGQNDVPGNPRYFARTVVTSVAGASNFCAKTQRMESVLTLAGQTATLSFWAKADASKNIATEFVQNFGSGGSPSATIQSIGVTTFALTTSWQRFSVTVSIPSIAGKTVGTSNSYFSVNFWFDAGSGLNVNTNSLGQQSGTFDIANVQIESGNVATSFEQRPVGMELGLCQRYYEQIGETGGIDLVLGGIATAGGQIAYYNFSYKVTKRFAAVVSKNGTWAVSNSGQPVAPNYTSTGFRAYVTAVAAGSFYAENSVSACNFTVSAEIT
jgi:hypothetical protein